MNQEGWDELKEQIKNRQEVRDKHPLVNGIRKLVLLFSLVIIPLIPLVVTENFVTHCALCQWFVRVMSSWIPGIAVISHASAIPNITALTVSLAWIGIFLLFIILFILLLGLETDNLFIFFPNTAKFLIFMYLGGLFFVMMELGLVGHFSFYHGTIGLFDPNSKRNIPNMFLQSKSGVAFFIWIEIICIAGLFIGWLMVNLQVFRKLIKKS